MGGSMKIVAFLLSLFVFFGMFLCQKKNWKGESIFLIFGLLLFSLISCIIPCGYSFLYRNYHSNTFIYFVAGSLLGYLFMKLCSYKYDKCDNIVLIGYSLFISFLLCINKFNIFSLIISILFYIVIGIYIRNSNSFIGVLIGSLLGVLLSFFTSWINGYVICFIIGLVLYFILSLFIMIFRNKNKGYYYYLIIGMVIGFLGSLL